MFTMNCAELAAIGSSPRKTNNIESRTGIINHLKSCRICDPLDVLENYRKSIIVLKRHQSGIPMRDIEFVGKVIKLYPFDTRLHPIMNWFLNNGATYFAIFEYTEFLSQDDVLRIIFDIATRQARPYIPEKTCRDDNYKMIEASYHLKQNDIEKYRDKPESIVPYLEVISMMHA